MYNIDFLDQIEELNRYLYGAGCVDTRKAAEEASKNAWLPIKSLEIISCVQAPNGEWVPITYKIIDDIVSENPK